MLIVILNIPAASISTFIHYNIEVLLLITGSHFSEGEGFQQKYTLVRELFMLKGSNGRLVVVTSGTSNGERREYFSTMIFKVFSVPINVKKNAFNSCNVIS